MDAPHTSGTTIFILLSKNCTSQINSHQVIFVSVSMVTASHGLKIEKNNLKTKAHLKLWGT